MRRSQKPWVVGPIKIPIYMDRLWLSAGPDIKSAMLALPKAFHDAEDDDYAACTMYRDRDKAVAFRFKDITHNTIAHEVFHLTHRVMEYHDDKFVGTNHEAYAYLQGWLAELIYRKLDKAGFKVRH